MFEEAANALPSAQVDAVKRLAWRRIPEGLSGRQYFYLGIEYNKMGWVAQAQESLRLAASSVDPVCQERATRYLRCKVPQTTVPVCAEAANIAGHNLIAAGDIQAAKQALEPLLETYPEFEWPYINLAAAYLKQGQIEKAKWLIRRLLSINPNQVDGWYVLCLAHVASGNKEDAQAAIGAALALYSEDDSDHALKSVVDAW